MKRSLQEYVELVVFGLVALLVGTGLLWLVGWVLSIGGVALKWVAGLLWTLLRFIVPVAIAGGLVYFLVKAAQDRQPKPATATAGAGTPAAPSTSYAATSPQGPAAAAASGPATASGPSADAVVTSPVTPPADEAATTTQGSGTPVPPASPEAADADSSAEPASEDDRA